MRLTYKVETLLAERLSFAIIDKHFDAFGTQLSIGWLIAIKASEWFIAHIAVNVIRLYNHIILLSS